MSKLMTDSDVLMEMLFDGNAPDDTPLSCTIAQLKEATLTVAELRVTAEYETKETIGAKLDTVNTALVETRKLMLGVQNDFRDLVEKHFKE